MYDSDVEALLSQLEAAPVVDWSELGEQTPVGAGEYCTASACAFRGARVAVKKLRQEKQSDPIAVSDLARETQLLARMRHENVISVVAQGTYACSSSARGQLPFLCLEMLASTLDAELPPSSNSASAWVRKAAVRAWPLSRSIDVAMQVARAMRYCHDEWMPDYRLLHRDIKPTNIGFNSSGRVVIYDFGLCKLWSRGGGKESDTQDLRKLTGLTGSLRYMAPEVALCQPYNHKAEVFSFGSVKARPHLELPSHGRHHILHTNPPLRLRTDLVPAFPIAPQLFYEMLSFQKPFHWCTPDVFMREVCHEGRRCMIPKNVPAQISDLLQLCWSESPTIRPEFRDIVPVLEEAYAAAVAAAQTPSRPDSSRSCSSSHNWRPRAP